MRTPVSYTLKACRVLSTREKPSVGGEVSVIFPAAQEALGGLQFKYGKHQLIV